MSWKTTDSAKRSGISDYNRGTIKQNTERFTADYGVISDLSLQNLYGFRDDGVNRNTLNIKADSLAFNKYDSSGVRALRIAVDSFDNALIGRKVSGIDAGIPDLSDSLCFTEDGKIVVFGDTPYTIPNTGGTLKPTFTVKGDVGVEEELYVDGKSHFYNSVDISGHVTVDSSMVINGDLTVFGVILPHFIGVSGDFRVGKDLLVVGDTSLHHFSATDGSINDLSVNYFHLLDDGYVNPGATLTIDGSMVINGEIIFNGGATEIGTVSISGDASYNGFIYSSKNLYLGSRHQQDDQPEQANKFIQATKSSMLTGDSYSMCFGQDISPGNQGQLSYYHNSDDSSRNTVTLGVFGKNNIAINSNGNVSIGRNLSNVTTTSSLDVSGNVKIAAQSDYIYTTPSLHIDNTSKNDSTGASIKLTGKRNYRSENVSNSEYPYTTGADIIFENYNDANPTSGSNAKIATKKIHGVIKTFQTDNSWNSGDMGFYGQDSSSLYAGTDTSGITEFMRFDASNQIVRFSKDVGIGGVTGPNVMQLVPGGHVLPQYPDISAVLDLRTYTYFGQSGRSEQPNWKGSNILLAPENKNTGVPSGLIWKTLAGDISGSYKDDYNNTLWKANYTKDSAAIKFMPEANYYRGGLAFFTNNTADVSTNAVERMRINQSGNVGIGTSSPSSTLDVSGDLNIQGQSTFNSNATMSYGASLVLNNQTSTSANISVHSNNVLEINNSEGVSIPSDVKGNLTLTTGYLSRDTTDSSGTDVPHGYLVGNYQFDASYVGKKSYPIFALDDNQFKQPSHTYLGDGNNGFYGIGYTQANNTIIGASNLSTNWGLYISAMSKVGSFIDGGEGADSFFNSGGGNVGIGTKGPSQKLDVNGDINSNGYRIGGNPMGIFGNTGNSQLLLSVNGAQNPALRVLSNSNIAIGHDDGAPSLLTIGNSISSNSSHTSTAFDSGTKILLGNQGSNTSGEVGSYYVIGFGAFDSTIATSSTGKYPPAYIGYQQQGYTDQTGFGDLVFGTKDKGDATTQAIERMRITNDGKIGIGTNLPQKSLHVVDEVVFGQRNSSIPDNNTNLTLWGNDSTNFLLEGLNSKKGIRIQTTTSNATTATSETIAELKNSDGNGFTINGNATAKFDRNVSIGQEVDDNNMLTVAGSGNPSLSVNNNGIVAINAYATYNTPNGTNQQNYNLYVSGPTNLGGAVNIEGNVTMGTSSNPLTFTYNGENLTTLINNSHGSQGYALLDGTLPFTGTVTAPSFNATSDVNKKEDIETISDATEKLTSLRGVSYKLIEDEEKKTHYGVVAQELEKVFPDMVHGEEGNKSVSYMEIIGVLIETVKDLNKRIQKLEESSK